VKGLTTKRLTLLIILSACLLVATASIIWLIKESEQKIPEKNPNNTTLYTYTLPEFEDEFEDETQEHASTVWNKIKESVEAKSVVCEKNSSVVVFIHPYSVGAFDPSSAEWIALISSVPEKTTETKIAIFRLDYQTFEIKKAYKFSYPVRDELTLEEGIAIMEEEMARDPYGSGSVSSESVLFLGGNYIYSYPALDFGGTIIVNKYAGTAIFYATTVWDGTGRLLIPEE